MTKTVVIHQPDFLPYLGFFHRLLAADVFVMLDHVQFVRDTSRAWTHRDVIKTPQGERWLTLSVTRAPHGTPINEVELAPGVGWRDANLSLIRENYRRAPFFTELFPQLEALYSLQVHRLVDFNIASVALLLELFDLSLPTVLSSSLDPRGQKNELLVDLVGKVGGNRYLSGQGAKAYLDRSVFERAGIEVTWQQFNHPVYPQLHGPFLPGLSSIDLMFNCGAAEARRILRRT